MRIALTQRVELVAAYQERRDALDQRWAVLLEGMGFTAVPVPNGLVDIVGWMNALRIEGAVLTGGNDVGASGGVPDRDSLEQALLDHARNRRIPVLGVCRGMQIMNVFLGGHLSPLSGHVATRHDVKAVQPSTRLQNIGPLVEVNSYHRFGIASEDLALSLRPLMKDSAGNIEAAEHLDLPWAAVMWHPERERIFSPWDRSLFDSLFGAP